MHIAIFQITIQSVVFHWCRFSAFKIFYIAMIYMIRLADIRPSTGYLYLANNNLLCQEFLIIIIADSMVLGYISKFRWIFSVAFGTKRSNTERLKNISGHLCRIMNLFYAAWSQWIENNWNQISTLNEQTNRNHSFYNCLHWHLDLAELQTELLPVTGANWALLLLSVVEHRIQ